MGMTALTLQDASSISGWISIGFWIVVYSPQIYSNWQLKSGEGLSVTFILLWLAGDLTNLFGGVLARLLPTMIILAVYYTLCDLVLLFQVYWYRRKARRTSFATETQPLIDKEPKETKPLLPAYVQYPLLALMVILGGIFAWYVQQLAGKRNHGNGGPIPEAPKADETELEWRSQVLGWASAALYLGSRVPQIVHNHKTRCAGLSLAMFFFSISGNVTYVMSIFFKSVARKYLIANTPWLIGSGGTVFLDFVILWQFIHFGRDKQQALLVDDEAASD